jgi:hypothetical protein
MHVAEVTSACPLISSSPYFKSAGRILMKFYINLTSFEISPNWYFLSPTVGNETVEDAWTCEEGAT